MFFITLLLAALVASSAQAGPVHKRIAQTIDASTAQWEQACLAAGGAEKCNPLSQTAFTTLLAAAGPCDQQNAADSMIDLAKSLSSSNSSATASMISLTQVFVQQPRNSPDSTQIPYCQSAPANSELNGLFQCQFTGTSDTFTGGAAAGSGASGTVPFGLKALKVARSCPANTQGGVADGSQLVALTTNPGLQNIGSIGTSSNSSPAANSSSSAATTATANASATSAATAAGQCAPPTSAAA